MHVYFNDSDKCTHIGGVTDGNVHPLCMQYDVNVTNASCTEYTIEVMTNLNSIHIYLCFVDGTLTTYATNEMQ